MSQRLEAMIGPAHTTSVAPGLALDALLCALRLLIDGGARGMADASLGTANLAFLALKSLELDRLVADGDRDHTFLAVEELVHEPQTPHEHATSAHNVLISLRIMGIDSLLRGTNAALSANRTR